MLLIRLCLKQWTVWITTTRSNTAHSTNVTTNHVPHTMPVLPNTAQLTGQHHPSLASSGLSHVSNAQAGSSNLVIPVHVTQQLHKNQISILSGQTPLYHNLCLTSCHHWRQIPGLRLDKVRPHLRNLEGSMQQILPH